MEFSVQHILDSLWVAAPLVVLMLGGIAVMIADLLLPAAMRWWLSLISIVTFILGIIALHLCGNPGGEGSIPLFTGMLSQSYLSYLAQYVILGGGLFLALISPGYLENRAIPHGEYYSLMIFSAMAMAALAASTELLTLFLNVEMLSIALYVLAGLEKQNLRSTEAAFKYFLLGSFAGAFLLLGIAFVFGATGETRYDLIAASIREGRIHENLFLQAGFTLIFIGFGFKLTLAPFHMYAPDVYEGAPTPVTAAIATGSKVAALAAFFPVVMLAAEWSELPRGVWGALYAVALVSMIVGNAGAVIQPNFKRMMAYSSIAHSGYAIVPMVVLLGVLPGLLAAPPTETGLAAIEIFKRNAREAVAYYLLAYTLMTLVAFGVAASIGPTGETRISNYAGLVRRNPGLAFLMLLAMISLLGIPGTVGFYGKLKLFSLAVQGDHYWLAVLGVLASVASAYYYLQLVVTMFMRDPEPGGETSRATLDGVNILALGIGGVSIFVFAIVPTLFLFLDATP